MQTPLNHGQTLKNVPCKQTARMQITGFFHASAIASAMVGVMTLPPHSIHPSHSRRSCHKSKCTFPGAGSRTYRRSRACSGVGAPDGGSSSHLSAKPLRHRCGPALVEATIALDLHSVTYKQSSSHESLCPRQSVGS